jgi:iron(III) transport system substrate-binding protein
MMRLGRILGGALGAWLLACGPLAAAALVVDGEAIADATLFDAAKKEGRVLLYGTWPESNFAPVKQAFESDTGISIDFVRFTTQMLFPRATAEFAAGKLNADYIDLTDLTLIRDLVQRGILGHPHKVPGFDRLAPEVRDAEGRWYVIFRLPQVMGINAAIVPKAEWPKSWLDLLQPQWQGKIGMPSLDVGGSAFTTFAFLREKVAPDYWSRLAANAIRIYPAVAPAISDLVRGEISISVTGASSFVEQMKSGAPVDVIFPSEGVGVFPIAGGLTTTGQHPNAAAVFLDWMTSKRGGTMIAQQGSYALNPDVAPPTTPSGITFPPLTNVWNIDVEHWENIRDSYSKEWRATFQAR